MPLVYALNAIDGSSPVKYSSESYGTFLITLIVQKNEFPDKKNTSSQTFVFTVFGQS